MSDKEEPITVRFPAGVKAALEKRSAEDRRSLNAEIVWLIEAILRGDFVPKSDAYDLVCDAIRAGSAPKEPELTEEQRRGLEEHEKSRRELQERERKARLANKKSA